jgi:3-hydroxybutyrate dehydrogenase
MNLNGKVALVTGSTSGIGLGIAKALAAEEADIMMNGFGDPAAIEALRSALAAEHGVRVMHDGADVSRAAPIAEMVARTEAEFGRLDILVNNAGIQHVASIVDFPAEKWDAIIAINLSSAFHTTQAAIPGMKSRGWGRIINIASAHGLVGSAEKSAYVAAKHGLIGLTKVTALELANDGITCNAICPGWVLTPLVQKQLDARASREGRDVADVTRAFLTDKQAMAKFSTPEGIGALTVFLCSDAAATMTGSPISIDGGWTAQ